jgi:hypothetical protein
MKRIPIYSNLLIAITLGYMKKAGHTVTDQSWKLKARWLSTIWFFSLLQPSCVESMMYLALHFSFISSFRFSSTAFHEYFFSFFAGSFFFSGRVRMNFSLTLRSFPRTIAVSYFSFLRVSTFSLVVLRPISSSSICTSKLCSF